MHLNDGRQIAQFREGLMLLLTGVRFLRRERSLWPLASVPIFFAVLAVAGAGTFFLTHLHWVHEAWAGFFPILEIGHWWHWLWVGPGRALFWILGWLAVVMSFAVAVLASLLIANLASAPFLDQLSQRVETLALGRPPQAAEDQSLLQEVWKSFAAELQRLGFLVGIWLSFSLLGFLVPGAHFLTGPLLVGTTILFLPLDYAGFALDRRGLSFSARRHWLREKMPTMVGFGGVAFLACLIPGLNLILLPSLVTAGTLLVLRLDPAA